MPAEIEQMRPGGRLVADVLTARNRSMRRSLGAHHPPAAVDTGGTKR
jgi:hypothetical protein